MPKINVYLPDRLAEQVKAAELPVSAVCQRALDRAVRQVGNIVPLLEAPSILGIYGRFVARAREALELSYDAAIKRGHDQVDTGHLLLGILEQGSNLGVHILESLGVSPDEVVLRLGDEMPPDKKVMFNASFDMVLTAGAQRALSLAAREAGRLGHRYIGNEHVLHGLAAEGEGTASRVLAGFGVDPDVVARTHAGVLKSWVAADRASLVTDGSEDPEQADPS